MRLSTTLLLAATTLFTLTGCGGLSSGEEDTGPMYVPPESGEYTPVQGVAANDVDGDCVGDTNQDGTVCGVGDVGVDGYEDPMVILQPGMVEEASVPLLCYHQSVILFTEEGCFSGYGTGIEDQGWTTCVIHADWATFNSERYQCAPFTDNGDEFRVNLWNPELDECNDSEDPSYGSQACWGILNDMARADAFSSRNEDGTYAASLQVVGNWAYPGDGTATGAE